MRKFMATIKEFDSKEYIADLNILCAQLRNTPFTNEIIRSGFKKIGLPSNILFWDVFRKILNIQRIEGDLYCFHNSKPIYISKLDLIYNEYKERWKQYYNNWYNKKRRVDTLKRDDIQEAIKLLNDNGFEVVRKIDYIRLK